MLLNIEGEWLLRHYVYQSTERHVSEDLNIYQHRSENLKIRKSFSKIFNFFLNTRSTRIHDVTYHKTAILLSLHARHIANKRIWGTLVTLLALSLLEWPITNK